MTNVERLPSVKIQDVTFTPKEPAHMGDQSNASLILRGPMKGAAFQGPSMSLTFMRPSNANGSARSLPPNISSEGLYEDYNYRKEGDPKPFGRCFFVFIGIHYAQGRGLVLRQLPDGNFERIGTCTCSSIGPHETKDRERNEPVFSRTSTVCSSRKSSWFDARQRGQPETLTPGGTIR